MVWMTKADEEDWKLEGLCNYGNPDDFFPDKSQVHEHENIKNVCYQCPVLEKCDDWATRHGERFGIWGGKFYPERKKSPLWNTAK